MGFVTFCACWILLLHRVGEEGEAGRVGARVWLAVPCCVVICLVISAENIRCVMHQAVFITGAVLDGTCAVPIPASAA